MIQHKHVVAVTKILIKRFGPELNPTEAIHIAYLILEEIERSNLKEKKGNV